MKFEDYDWHIPINNHGNEGVKPLKTILLEKNIDVFEMTYEELTSVLLEGNMDMNSFLYRTIWLMNIKTET